MEQQGKISIWKRKTTLAIAICFILNPFSHFLENIVGIGNTYYISYICWGILFVLFFSGEKVIVIKSQIIITAMLFISFVIGAIQGKIYLNTEIDSILVGGIICIAYMVTMCKKNINRISGKELFILLRIVVVIGVIASLYAMIFQYQHLVLLLRGIDQSLNSWQYVSFFRQRNIFAGYCFIATIAACYLYLKTKKKLYAVCILLFGIQIILTDSRAALLGYAIIVGLCFYYTRKSRVVLVLFSIMVAILVLYAFDIGAFLLENFSHTTSSGEDSASIRVSMWMECLKYIWDKKVIIGGFGMGGSSLFLTPLFGVGSSHNVYIEALFNGGLIFLFVIIYGLVTSFKLCNRNKKDIEFVYVWKAAIIAYAVYCLFEAGAMLYCGNYFSVTITMLLIFIPRCYLERDKY